MEQILDVLSKVVVYLITSFGYVGVFFTMVLQSTCIPLPSEIILPLAGYMVFLGKLSYWKITVLATLANVVGGLIAYYFGKFAGRPFILSYGRYIFITESKLRKTEYFFDKYGEITVFVGRMLPVIRTFISVPAGIAKMNVIKMSVYTFLGSLPWCALLIWYGYELGENWGTLKQLFHKFHLLLGLMIFLIFILLLVFLFVSKRK